MLFFNFCSYPKRGGKNRSKKKKTVLLVGVNVAYGKYEKE